MILKPENSRQINFDLIEMDVTAILGVEETDPNPSAALTLVKELYILHYFKHENLLHAYFTLTEPDNYRMYVGLPQIYPIMAINPPKEDSGISYNDIFKYVVICILRALAFLHECGIGHQNVKISSCFFDGRGNVLLGGFEKVNAVSEESGMILLCFYLLIFIFQSFLRISGN